MNYQKIINFTDYQLDESQRDSNLIYVKLLGRLVVI